MQVIVIPKASINKHMQFCNQFTKIVQFSINYGILFFFHKLMSLCRINKDSLILPHCIIVKFFQQTKSDDQTKTSCDLNPMYIKMVSHRTRSRNAIINLYVNVQRQKKSIEKCVQPTKSVKKLSINCFIVPAVPIEINFT